MQREEPEATAVNASIVIVGLESAAELMDA